MHNKKLTFNIIYIPGTVNYQAIPLISLLLNSDFNFKLIGNGLNESERNMLKQISSVSDRLEYINIESKNIIPHGTLLDLMFLSESESLYCFCDSDLFLFDEIKTDFIKEKMEKHQVLSSGGRIENESDSIYAGFKGGATTKSPDGRIDLATSFFCVYNREFLQSTIDQYGVGFEQYRLDLQIPKHASSVINKMNLEYEMFDTGKLLSILMHDMGGEKYFTEFTGLVHIGGMSGRYLQDLDINKKVIINDDLNISSSNKVTEYNIRNDYEISLKKLYGKYFYCYLNHLIGKGPEPLLNSSNQRVQDTVKRLAKSISKIVEEGKQREDTLSIFNIISSK